ncbi:MAG: hypothetical protein XD98_0417 [Microgenomates bacterium 39_6]|nr:MAG: hypothetical protein XD98_0417 [Microgenomates bacterium 39_6]
MKWLTKKTNWLVFIFCLFLNWLILRPILLPDTFFLAHDSTWLVRLQQFDKAVSLGQFPPQLAPDMAYGFGYPLFKYYAPLFTFLSWFIFKLIGDYALSITLTVFLANLVGSWGMFLLGKKIYGFWGGLVAAAAFSLLPFRALDIYVRAALAELLAINLFPFWLYYFLSFVHDKINKKIIIGFILTSLGLLLAHNLYLIILACFSPLFLIFFLTGFPKKKKLLAFFGACFLTFLLASWFWLPVFLGLGEVGVLEEAAKTNFSDNFVYLKQLWNWPWGFGGSAPGLADGMSFKIGKIHLLLAGLGVLAGLLKKQTRRLTTFFLILALSSLFLTLPWSRPIWESLSFLATIQFPWRFLGLAAPIIALLSGGIALIGFKSFPVELKKITPLISLLAIFLLFYFNLKYFVPQSLVLSAKEELLDRETIYRSAENIAEYYPIGVEKRPEKKPNWPLSFSGDQDAQVVAETPYKIIFRLNEKGPVTINRFYFPGWRLNWENETIPINPEPETGKIQFQAEETGEYQLSFGPTKWDKVAYGLTFLGFIILVIVIIF